MKFNYNEYLEIKYKIENEIKKSILNNNKENILLNINYINEILNNYEILILNEFIKDYDLYLYDKYTNNKNRLNKIEKKINEINKIFNELLLIIEFKENLKNKECYNILYYNTYINKNDKLNKYFIIKFKNYDRFIYLLRKLIIEILNINKNDYRKYNFY